VQKLIFQQLEQKCPFNWAKIQHNNFTKNCANNWAKIQSDQKCSFNSSAPKNTNYLSKMFANNWAKNDFATL